MQKCWQHFNFELKLEVWKSPLRVGFKTKALEEDLTFDVDLIVLLVVS